MTAAGMEMLRTAAQANATALRAAIAEARLSAAHLPELVRAERLVLGMTTDHHDLHDAPALDPVAIAVATDPAARDLAIRLLDQTARAAPDVQD